MHVPIFRYTRRYWLTDTSQILGAINHDPLFIQAWLVLYQGRKPDAHQKIEHCRVWCFFFFCAKGHIVHVTYLQSSSRRSIMIVFYLFYLLEDFRADPRYLQMKLKISKRYFSFKWRLRTFLKSPCITMGRGWLEFLVFGADGARKGEAVRSSASLPLSCNDTKYPCT